ncbi:unnamed protein product [Trichobilharzia regenti]|nr:unnamed protein product [Trichobilharzia regenti]
MNLVHDEEQLNPVRVEINNLKASLIFMETDINADDVDEELNALIIDTADAYLVIYAVDDRSSFYAARKIIGLLLSQCKRSSAIILAANKSDLVRTRVVTSEVISLDECPEVVRRSKSWSLELTISW